MQVAIGHNNPPSEIEILKERLNSYQDEIGQFKRLSEFEPPQEIASDEEAGKITEYIKNCKSLNSRFADIHKKEKAPFWDAGKAADAWKNDYETRIVALVNKASAPIIAWNKKKEEAERQRQLEIARKAREEAERLAEQAAAHEAENIKDTAQELLGAAIQADTKAEMIENNALAVKARSRSDNGAVSSVSKVWTGELESLAALDLDALRQYFSADAIDKAIKAAIRDGKRDIRGVKIYQADKLNVR